VKSGVHPHSVTRATDDPIYVLNRFTNTIAVVDTATLAKLSEIALHDASPATIRQGRRFLYDAILASAHGDAACSSCHVSGNTDGIAWDQGDPTGNLAAYTIASDNVRFVTPSQNQPAPCAPTTCAAHVGFDPQKGPMATQTLRGMLEPLHWRGDRATMNDFNQTFVGLLGAHDVGPVNGGPAGLSAADMETYRQFALGIRFPPNPNRSANDTLPTSAPIPGTGLMGNPTNGEVIFNSFLTVGAQPCVACHAHPFGAAGGRLGGVTPQEPTTVPDAAAVTSGNNDASPHSDLKVAHLRNLVDKPGFLRGPASGPFPDVKTGISVTHDGSFPNLPTYFSRSIFTITAGNARDLSSFVLHFPTGIKPAVGRNLTCPAGAPPRPGCDETLLATLLSLGDIASAGRHCELTATTLGGGRIRSYRLIGGAWATDAAGESPLTSAALRQGAEGPISFLCATIGSGWRLGGDRDEDAVLNGDDCAPADPLIGTHPVEVASLVTTGSSPTEVSWASQSGASGPATRYDLVGGLVSELRAGGILAATSCILADLTEVSTTDPRPNPIAGDGYYYLVRAESPCGSGGFGANRSVLDALPCAGP